MKKLIFPLLLVLLLAGHFLWLHAHVVPAYASPDADGYFAQARLLVTEQRVSFRAESPLQYVGTHWLATADDRFVSRYPPGLPTLLAGAWAAAGGPDAAFLVNPALATLTLLFIFLLCLPRAGTGLALLAALVFAASPLANQHAIHSDAHTAATFFLVAGLWLLDAWARGPAWWKAVGAGLLLGAVPTVRYAEGVAAVGVVVFLAFQFFRRRERRGQIWLAVIGAAIPVGLQLVYNQLALGAFWRTAYTLTNEQQLGLEWFLQNWEGYLNALMFSGVGVFFALGLAGLAGMFTDREARPFAVCLFLVILGITAVYAGYYFSRGVSSGYIRFLLPTLPLYLPPAMWLLRRVRPRRAMAAAAIALAAFQVARGVPDSLNGLRQEAAGAERSRVAIAWLDEHVPDGSVLVGTRRLFEQIHFRADWKLADADVLLGRERGRRGGGGGFRMGGPPGAGPGMDGPGVDGPGMDRPGAGGRDSGSASDQPSPMQPGKTDRLRARYSRLDLPARAAAAYADLLAWAGERPIYWVGRLSDLETLRDRLKEPPAVEKIGEIVIPRLAESERVQVGGAGLRGRGPGGLGGPGGPPGMGGGRGRRPQVSPFSLRPGTKFRVFLIQRPEAESKGKEPAEKP